MGIGAFNRRPIFQNEGYSVDAGGGPSDVVTEQWQTWARFKDRSGSSIFAQSQGITNYDYEVEVRFDGRFKSTTKMIYEGQVCIMQSMSIKTEGFKNFIIMQFKRTDTYVDIS